MPQSSRHSRLLAKSLRLASTFCNLPHQINDRFSFRRFVGLGVSDDVPDATTFCRFRQDLLGQKLSEKLFHLVLGQLLKKGDLRCAVKSRRHQAASAVLPRQKFLAKAAGD